MLTSSSYRAMSGIASIREKRLSGPSHQNVTVPVVNVLKEVWLKADPAISGCRLATSIVSLWRASFRARLSLPLQADCKVVCFPAIRNAVKKIADNAMVRPNAWRHRGWGKSAFTRYFAKFLDFRGGRSNSKSVLLIHTSLSRSL